MVALYGETIEGEIMTNRSATKMVGRPLAPGRKSAKLDNVFHALANRTRRMLLEQLRTGPTIVTKLAEFYDMSLNAISKHLIVLEKAGLIRREKQGRTHICWLCADPLADAGTWLLTYRDFWHNQLDQLAAFVEDSGAPTS